MVIPTTVESDQILPDKVDVAIIGAGIAGICTALELAERGLSVAVFEKGIVAGEQSGHNWGWCRQMGRDPREVPLVKISMDMWRGMNARIQGETGFKQCGIAYLCESDEQMAYRENWYREQAIPHKLSTQLLSGSDAQKITPDSSFQWIGGTITPDDGRAEPHLATPVIARAAQKNGVQIFQNCAVRGYEKQAGNIASIVTEKGEVKCQTLVLAAGAWSRRFLYNMDLELPQLSVISSVLRTVPFDAGIETTIAGGGVALRKRLDGGYTVADDTYSTADIIPDSFRLMFDFLPTLKNEWRDFRYRIGKRFLEEAMLKRRWKNDEISPFEKIRILDPSPHKRTNDAVLAALHRVHPQFANALIAEQWAGVIDVVPDAVPVISGVPSVPGLYISTGFSGHGFGLGPGAGLLMSQIILNDETAVDPSPYRFGRFE